MTTTTSNIQDKILEFINHFSEIKKIFKIKDKFIQSKLSEQEIEFQNFAKDYDHKLSTHADDLFTFLKHCEEDNISHDELLSSLRKLSDAKLNKSKSELVNKLESIKNCINEVINEITEYNEKIAEKTGASNKINEMDKNKQEAILIAKGSVFFVGIASIMAIPFTAGASAFIIPANVIATLSMNLTAYGAGAVMVSAAIAGASSIHVKFLNYKLKSLKEQISQFLNEMRKCLEEINIIIAHCESHFENQISEIEEVEKVVNFIKKKLDDGDGRQLIKPIARTISTRARKNSECYNVDMRQVLKFE